MSLSPIDIERVRNDTPACKELIHFNNAGAALMPSPVLEANINFLKREAAIGGYEAADEAGARLEDFYDKTALLINCKRDEIAFVENATRAWDMAFYSLPLNEGDEILTGYSEYVSNYIALLQVSQRTSAKLIVVPNDEHGQLCTKTLRAKINKNTKLIAITHVPTSGGLINPAREVGQIAAEAGVPFLLDTCQSLGQIPVDVQDIQCSFLCGTGRKFLRGPRGTGFLYVKENVLNKLTPPFLDLHAARLKNLNEFEVRQDARKFESWESNVAGKIALTKAIEYALDIGIHNIFDRVTTLANTLRQELSKLPGISVVDLGKEKSGIVTFVKKDMAATEISQKLRHLRANASVSTNAYAQLDLGSRGLDDVVRASLHYYNTEQEIDNFVEKVSRLA